MAKAKPAKKSATKKLSSRKTQPPCCPLFKPSPHPLVCRACGHTKDEHPRAFKAKCSLCKKPVEYRGLVEIPIDDVLCATCERPTEKRLREEEQREPVKKSRVKRERRRCGFCSKYSFSRNAIRPVSHVKYGVDWAHAVCIRKHERVTKKAAAVVAKLAKKTPPKPPPVEEIVPIDPLVLAVYRDVNGIPYLRVTRSKGHAEFIVAKRWQIERVSIDAETVQALNLQIVDGADIAETARLLLRPVNESIIVTHRAKCALRQIIKVEEIETMATATETKFAAVTAPKGGKKPASKPVKAAAEKKAAPKKAAVKAEATERAPRISVVTLKKMPKDEGSLPSQAMTILNVLKAKGGKTTTDKLFNELEKKIDTAQPVARIYAFYRKRLIDGGHIAVAKAE